MLLKNVLHQKLNWVSMFASLKEQGILSLKLQKAAFLFLSGKHCTTNWF